MAANPFYDGAGAAMDHHYRQEMWRIKEAERHAHREATGRGPRPAQKPRDKK